MLSMLKTWPKRRHATKPRQNCQNSLVKEYWWKIRNRLWTIMTQDAHRGTQEPLHIQIISSKTLILKHKPYEIIAFESGNFFHTYFHQGTSIPPKNYLSSSKYPTET